VSGHQQNLSKFLYFAKASQTNYHHVICCKASSKFVFHMLMLKGYHVRTNTKLKNWFCAYAIKNLRDKNSASSDESSKLVFRM